MYRLKTELDSLGVSRVSELRQQIPYITENRIVPYLQATKITRYFNEKGGALGKMGLPRGDMLFLNDKSVTQNFESGYIAVSSKGDVEIYADTYIRVEFRGALCLDESSEWSSEDEPYFIISYADTGGNSATNRIGPVSVDKGTFVSTGIGSLFKFQRRQFFLNVVTMENDQGSPEEASNKVRSTVGSTAAAVSAAVAGFSPLAGGIILATGGILAAFSGVISPLLGLGDDVVGEHTQFFFEPETEFVTPPVIGTTKKGHEYNYLMRMGSDSEGIYDIYFMIYVLEGGSIEKKVE